MKKIITGILIVLLVFAIFPFRGEATRLGRAIRAILGRVNTWTASQTFTGGSASSPSVALDDDGDSGFYSDTDDNIKVSIGGIEKWTITDDLIFGASAARAGIVNETTSATNPGILAKVSDLNSGMGYAATSQPNMIANSLEIARFDGTAGSGASLWVMGGVSLWGGDPMGGLTTFIAMASGASPAATSSLPSQGVNLYVVSEELWVVDSGGDQTQLSPHDPVTGEWFFNSFNSFTGKGIKYYPMSGISEEYTVPKVDWTANQVTYQRKGFINSYTQRSIEVPQGQATGFPDIEVDDVPGQVRYRWNKGKKEVHWVSTKKMGKGKVKEIKPDHWLDGKDGKFYRKRTKAEAIAAFTADISAIGQKWDNLPPFLKAEITDPRL